MSPSYHHWLFIPEKTKVTMKKKTLNKGEILYMQIKWNNVDVSI